MSKREFDSTIRSWEDYQRVYDFSLRNPDEFWATVAQRKIHWRKPWTRVSNWNYQTAEVSWYEGAELNIAENCVDRHVRAGKGDQPAIIWVGNELHEERILTYSDLQRETCRIAHGLEKLGVKKGDRVVFYLPNVPELAIGILACARIGAIHSVIFGGFSSHSIQNRVNDCGAKIIITADGALRGTKLVDLNANVDEAMAMGCPSVEKVVILHRLDGPRKPKRAYDLWWDEVFHSELPTTHPTPSHGAEDPFFILYTSGSTGKPKGVLHTMGGYLTYAAYTHEIVFQVREGDVFWCTADLGWITGHSYLVYGPLANGVTTVMFEGIPTHPDPGRFWQVVDRHHVTIFYTAPTAIRILAAAGDTHVRKHSRNSIRILGTVGEPINPEAWRWYDEVVGDSRSPVVDTWWQTETGGILISPLAGITPTQPGSATLPLPGIEPRLVNSKGVTLEGEQTGALVLARSWPGQMRGVYGDPGRFRETYFSQFPGYYFTGDGAKRDATGNYWITGRIDDVIQVAGHRLGTAEIESACILHPEVAEAGAVGVPDAITGEALHVFIALKNPEKSAILGSIGSEITALIRKEVGPLATAKKVHVVPGLPKTRSGKIMRRILRKLATGEVNELGDTSTLADPSIVDKLKEALR